jgi:hypothetical protein
LPPSADDATVVALLVGMALAGWSCVRSQEASVMNGKTMEERVTDLEKLARTLAPLPEEVRGLKVRVGAVESQIVQLRTDMNVEFSAVRGEMAGMKTELRGEMAAMKDELREDIAAIGRETAAHVLGLHRGLDDIRGEIQRSTQQILGKLNER